MTRTTQPRLFPAEPPRPVPDFDGATYDRTRDHARLSKCLMRVYCLMRSGKWWTLEELQQELPPSTRTGHPVTTQAIGARIRDLRKVKFGGFNCPSRVRAGSSGLWEYRMEGESK